MSRCAFLFPGQGAFYPSALRQTRLAYPGVDKILSTVEKVARRRFGKSLLDVLWDENSSAATLLETDPELLQLAIFTVSVAAFEMLAAENIRPDVLVGHSFGEIAALTCAGAFTVEQGASIVCERVEALTSALSQGSMAAISASKDAVNAHLQKFPSLQVAVVNHASQTVVSGVHEQVQAFLDHCVARGLSGQRLNSPCAFHHTDLETAAQDFAFRLEQYKPGVLKYPVYSPILGRHYRADDDFGFHLARHLTLPVDFLSAVRFLQSEKVGTYIECGALDALTKIVIRIVGPGNAKVFPALTQATDELIHIRKIIHHFKELNTMNAPLNTALLGDIAQPDFETFWNDRGPVLLSQIKSEFLSFLGSRPALKTAAPSMAAAQPAVAAKPTPVPAQRPAAPSRIARPQLFEELVKIYAEAMEYPHEVFNESVELEAELGIDSVKQTEIIQRISNQYRLPPLPANFRAGDFKAMGQIVDFVFAHQGEAEAVAA